MHNLASLLQSPFHRSTAIQLHAELLSIPSLRTAILDTLSLSLLPGTQNRDIIGSWLVAALEEGRRAGGVGLRSWEESTAWLVEGAESDGRLDLTPQLSTLAEYLSLAILDPPSLHDDIHPSPIASTPAPPLPQKTKGKGKQPYMPPPPAPVEPTVEETEHAEEKWARYRIGGLVGLSWLLSQLKKAERPLSEEVSRLLHNSALWSCLSSLPSEEGSAAFGHNHPPVRRAAYTVLGVVVDAYPEEIAKEDILQTLAGEMLDAIWVEKEGTVWEAAGPAVAKILSRELRGAEGSRCLCQGIGISGTCRRAVQNRHWRTDSRRTRVRTKLKSMRMMRATMIARTKTRTTRTTRTVMMAKSRPTRERP